MKLLVILVPLAILFQSNSLNPSEKETFDDFEIIQSAGIYYAGFFFESSLLYEFEPDLTKEKVDYLKAFIEKKCSDKLNVDAKCIYNTNRKGNIVVPTIADGVDGFPFSMLWKSRRNHQKDFYIQLYINVTNKGLQLKVGNKKSIIKPKVEALVRIFNANKKVIFKNRLVWTNLKGLVRLEKKSAMLNSNHIINIIESTISSLLK